MDNMREEIQRMRQSLDALLESGMQISRPKPDLEPRLRSKLARVTAETTSPARSALSAREDNTHMAMTRENSVELGASGETVAGGSVMVEDPMGSLYEVTRLRNIRSNRAKMVRPVPDNTGEVNDFIARGVISEVEAAELYQR